MAHFGAFDLACQARQPEIGQHHLSFAIEHDIARLEVAMQHALLMRRGEAGA